LIASKDIFMTSQINPNDIDGNYPVAGVPNNTQGFRDNFTNTSTNFQYAADEITELQNKAVVKAALSGTTLDNNMNDGLIYSVKLEDVSWTYVQNTATSGSITLDYSAGQYQYVSTSGSISLGFSNWPISGTAGMLQVAVNVTNTAYTLTLPAAVTLGIVGIQGISSNVITFDAIGTYQFQFTTTDNGTTITVYDLNRPLLGSAGSAVGYSTGTGGAVTQITSKATGVTLNKRCGQITLNNAALSAAAEVSFTLTNSVIAATDVVYVCISSGATAGAYNVQVDAVAAGSCRISVGNMSAGPLSEAIVLNFVVIKAVNA
jgi:hypothetical protein